MKINSPLSAAKYLKENKDRTALCVFMMFLETLMFLAGNYINSEISSYKVDMKYSDSYVITCAESDDEDYKDFNSFVEDVKNDSKLQYVMTTGYGFSGFTYNTVLNLQFGSHGFVFNSVEDMKKVFDHWGIDADLSNCKNGSIVISRDLANNRGIRLGDKLDRSFEEHLNYDVTVDAIIDDGSYSVYYIYEDSQLVRINIFSDTMEGDELYNYVYKLLGNRKVAVYQSVRDIMEDQLSIFDTLFYIVDILISIVLAFTINLVVSGHYMKRKFEFGIYMALGKSKGNIRKKIAAEILIMEGIALAVGTAVILLFTYLINELYYIPSGRHLVYCSPLGIFGALLCMLLVTIPLILSNSRSMCRADVTEF